MALERNHLHVGTASTTPIRVERSKSGRKIYVGGLRRDILTHEAQTGQCT